MPFASVVNMLATGALLCEFVMRHIFDRSTGLVRATSGSTRSATMGSGLDWIPEEMFSVADDGISGFELV